METKQQFSESFAKLGLKEEILQSLAKAGFHTPSPIQEQVIPLIISGSDVIGHAQTGTGKTAAFALPALHLLQNTGKPEVLVITPTRELASQVSEEICRLGSFLRVKAATVYGGKSFHTQIDAIKRGAHVVVATPGRLLDLLQGGKIPSLSPSIVIIDEADEMLDMGFLEDLQAIFDFLPAKRQTLMFSATMPPAIQSLAKKILNNPTVIKASPSQTTNIDIEQYYCPLNDAERDDAVIRLFEARDMGKSIIFCKTKKEVDRLLQVLTKRGQSALALHGDMEQPQREQVIHNFRSGACMTLIATDVAARGINIVDVAHVINYHIPFDPENYVHRIGRTGRAGRKGVSITFVTPKEYPKLIRFQKIIQTTMNPLHIPSKREIRALQLKKILEQAAIQVPSPEIISAVSSGKQNSEILAAQLLDYLLSKNPIEGAETIGITEPLSAKKEFSSRGRGGRGDRWTPGPSKFKKKFSSNQKSFKKKPSFK